MNSIQSTPVVVVQVLNPIQVLILKLIDFDRINRKVKKIKLMNVEMKITSSTTMVFLFLVMSANFPGTFSYTKQIPAKLNSFQLPQPKSGAASSVFLRALGSIYPLGYTKTKRLVLESLICNFFFLIFVISFLCAVIHLHFFN